MNKYENLKSAYDELKKKNSSLGTTRHKYESVRKRVGKLEEHCAELFRLNTQYQQETFQKIEVLTGMKFLLYQLYTKIMTKFNCCSYCWRSLPRESEDCCWWKWLPLTQYSNCKRSNFFLAKSKCWIWQIVKNEFWPFHVIINIFAV